MTRERLTAIVNAYGGNAARWPEDERAAAVSFLESDPGARGLIDDALRLDDALDCLPHVRIAPSIHARVIAAFDAIAAKPSLRRVLARLSEAIWPGAPWWQPSAALGMALIIGIMLGVMAPLGSAAQNTSSDMTVAFSAPATNDMSDEL